MKNQELLFDENIVDYKYNFNYDDNKKAFIYKKANQTLNIKFIYELINIISAFCKEYAKMPLIIDLSNNNKFDDKLIIIFVEIIAYISVSLYEMNLRVYYSDEASIVNYCLKYSPLKYLNDKRKYVNKFETLEKLEDHYREIYKYDEFCINTIFLSMKLSGLEEFFKNKGIVEVDCKKLGKTIIELIENELVHGESDVFLDIDVTDARWIKNKDINNGNYYGINIVIIGFSKKNIYELLKKNLPQKLNYSEKYKLVNKAYSYHSKHFDDSYTENDFYIISSFQDKISGSIKKDVNGGTGLTQLIKRIEEEVDSYKCYMISGCRILYFIKDLLKMDNNSLVGFNMSSQYLDNIPDKEVLIKSDIYMPGVAYNLSFAIKKGVNNE